MTLKYVYPKLQAMFNSSGISVKGRQNIECFLFFFKLWKLTPVLNHTKIVNRRGK